MVISTLFLLPLNSRPQVVRNSSKLRNRNPAAQSLQVVTKEFRT